MTCAEYSEYIILLSTFWINIFNFHIFLYPLKYVPDPCDVKMDRNKQRHPQRRTPMIYYVTGFFKHSKSWNKNKDIYDQSSPRFSHCKKYIYNTAQIDSGFGQVHIVWWLSYSQVGEKISVKPCHDAYPILQQEPTYVIICESYVYVVSAEIIHLLNLCMCRWVTSLFQIDPQPPSPHKRGNRVYANCCLSVYE